MNSSTTLRDDDLNDEHDPIEQEVEGEAAPKSAGKKSAPAKRAAPGKKAPARRKVAAKKKPGKKKTPHERRIERVKQKSAAEIEREEELEDFAEALSDLRSRGFAGTYLIQQVSGFMHLFSAESLILLRDATIATTTARAKVDALLKTMEREGVLTSSALYARGYRQPSDAERFAELSSDLQDLLKKLAPKKGASK